MLDKEKIARLVRKAITLTEGHEDRHIVATYAGVIAFMEQAVDREDYKSVREYVDRVYDHWANGHEIDEKVRVVINKLNRLLPLSEEYRAQRRERRKNNPPSPHKQGG